MSWNKEDGKWKEANELLKTLLTQYEFISRAPAHPNDYQRQLEKAKQYKATDSAGNVYLIQNPAAWDEIDGKKSRPAPQLVYTFAQLKQEAALKGKDQGLKPQSQKLIGGF